MKLLNSLTFGDDIKKLKIKSSGRTALAKKQYEMRLRIFQQARFQILQNRKWMASNRLQTMAWSVQGMKKLKRIALNSYRSKISFVKSKTIHNGSNISLKENDD